RSDTTGEINAEYSIVCRRGRAIGERQGGGIVDPNQRYRMLRAGRGVGVVDGNCIALRQAGQVDVETTLRRRRYRRACGGFVRQRLRNAGGQRIELILRLNEVLIAHLEVGRNRAGPDSAVLDEIDRCACRRNERNGANTTE